MKLFHKSRNVLFVITENDYFRVAFALEEKAYKNAQLSDLPDKIKQKLTTAKVYAEGRPIRFEIRSKEDFETLCRLI